MYTFLFLIIPITTITLMVTNEKFTFRSLIPPAVFGGLAGTVVSAIKKFFIFSTYTWIDSPVTNVLHFFLTQGFLPVLLCAIVFYPFSRDTGEYKGAAAVPLLGFFNSIFIPFCIFTNGDNQNLFMLIESPLLYAAMTAIVGVSAEKILPAFAEKKPGIAIALILIAVAALFVPSVTHVIWYSSISDTISLSVTIAFAVFSLGYVILCRKIFK